MQIIGREQLIELLWQQMKVKTGLVLSANRRIGKTTIIKEMEKQANKEGYRAVYEDLEGIRSQLDFSKNVKKQVQTFRGKKDKAVNGLANFYDLYVRESALGQFKFGAKKTEPEWKERLNSEMDFVAEHATPTIFFWDEFPIMLSNIIKDHGKPAAMEVLDVLRAVREKHSGKIKMVFTGSIGIHLIIADLKKDGYKNQPINNMHIQEVNPLELEFAVLFAKELLTSEGLNLPDDDIEALVQEVDCIPFYINELVNAIKQEVPGKHPKEIVTDCLTKSTAHWNLRPFEERIGNYYSKHEHVFRIIDSVAYHNSRTVEEITEDAKLAGTITPNEVREIIAALGQDQYFVRNGDVVTFRFKLLRQWWLIQRKCDS
jgi:AAA+ ATPase superfamily predicted ATPase